MKKLIYLLPVMAFVSCNGTAESTGNTDSTNTPEPKVYTEIQKASWFIGNWENLSDEGNLYESWTQTNDSVYSGTSCFVAGTDTFSYEVLSLEQTGNDLFYIPTIQNENDGLPVRFKLNATSTSDHLVFENPEHDFPTAISYRLINPDSMVAQISGSLDGLTDTAMVFPMRRAQ